jgi:tetratricopeptide (TPR) repeat protein
MAASLGTVILLSSVAPAQNSAPRPTADELPLTTKSPEARRLVVEGMALMDKMNERGTFQDLRKAVQIDPDFAMAHEFLSQKSQDPAERLSEQQKAFALRKLASPQEQLVIEWHQDVVDAKLVPAIQEMNQLLAQLPHDQRIVDMLTSWLDTQGQRERCIEIFEASGINSPGLMNEAAYWYANLRQYDKALALLDKYIAAFPNEPNPQDSYAEVQRMAGHFDQALEHYHASLKNDPKFYYSQFELGNTYLLMGNPVRARQEFAIGFQKFTMPQLHVLLWRTRDASTYVVDGNYAAADRGFQATADYAHTIGVSWAEADVYREMAMYQPDSKRALELLDKAETALQEGKNSTPGELLLESAKILRLRVEVAIEAGDKDIANSALAKLGAISQATEDGLIQAEYHGAAGALLFSEQKHKEAISDLAEDSRNPFSLKRLVASYEGVQDAADAERTAAILSNWNDPSLEQSLVVPGFRKCWKDATCSPH